MQLRGSLFAYRTTWDAGLVPKQVYAVGICLNAPQVGLGEE